MRFIPLILFVGYFFSITLFSHTHYINNVKVVHSHPFSSNDNHQHSQQGFQLISSLSHFYTTTFYTASTLLILKFCIEILRLIFTPNARVKQYGGITFLRPPPVVA